MKLKFSLKDKEFVLDADAENLISKKMDQNNDKPDRITRYQIKQEEKRKNKELEQKEQLKYLFILLGVVGIFAVIGIVASVLGI